MVVESGSRITGRRWNSKMLSEKRLNFSSLAGQVSGGLPEVQVLLNPSLIPETGLFEVLLDFSPTLKNSTLKFLHSLAHSPEITIQTVTQKH